jgi:hypothetical protein
VRCNKARDPFIAHHGKAIRGCRFSAAALQAIRFVFSSLWTIGGHRQDLRHTATGIRRMTFASSDGLKNRCASEPVRTWKNWMISRQGPQWKAMRGTSVFVISPEQRGQSGFMEVLESRRGDTMPGNTVMYATECNPNSLSSAARICPLGGPILTVENRAVVEAIHPEIGPVVTAPQKRFDVGMRASREQATALERPVQNQVLHGVTGGEGRLGPRPSRAAGVRQAIPHSGLNTTQRQSRQ